jgi:hypothetical protein
MKAAQDAKSNQSAHEVTYQPNHLIKYSSGVPPQTGAQHRINHATDKTVSRTAQKIAFHMAIVLGEC